MSTQNFSKILKNKFQNRVLFDEPIKKYVAYQIGGPADSLIFPINEEELLWISHFSKEKNIPLTIIGQGTNLLVSDKGIRGITLSLLHAFKNIDVLEENPDSVLVRTGGGVEKQAFLSWAIDHSFSGLEFSSGVPGTLGGGIFMNAGTKYGCYADILRRVRLFNFDMGGRDFLRNEIDFGYRKQDKISGNLVVHVDFELKKGNKEMIACEVGRIIKERAEKQPLDFPSCGSTFKNPEGFSAGRLIEQAGLKGLIEGQAQVSEKHANFILNKGGATAQDICTLIKKIQKEVFEKFSVTLEPEVIFIGDYDT